ncbi:MAG: hypothetical protein QOJ19_4255 [Acidimicrobiia bacterium]|jgi:(p)ppGpp synthase/HD superfamily hydrolase|nr:hypothetical protein [Acidimicrobiia bacterium]
MTAESAEAGAGWQGALLTRRIAEAVDFAVRAHGTQVRKGTHIPYVSHLLGVAGLVFEGGGDEDQVIAGLLHDVLEDTPATPAQIVTAFGQRVADIVEACSDTQTKPKPPWFQRKQRYLDHLKDAPPDVLLVSLADKLHNARALLLDLRTEGPHVFNRFNAGPGDTLWYYQKLAAIFSARCPGPLAAELARVVSDLHDEVSEANA